MKKYFFLLLTALTLRAEIPPNQYRIFSFDPPSPTNRILAYRVYLTRLPPIPGSTNYLFTTTNNTFIVSNLLAIPQRVRVTASNVWGEEDVGANYDFPGPPQAATNLRSVENLIEFVPPYIVESTKDLIVYDEYFTVGRPGTNGAIFIRFRQQPTEPFKFFRTRALPPSAKPPALP